jgi:hypothetical protein
MSQEMPPNETKKLGLHIPPHKKVVTWYSFDPVSYRGNFNNGAGHAHKTCALIPVGLKTMFGMQFGGVLLEGQFSANCVRFLPNDMSPTKSSFYFHYKSSARKIVSQNINRLGTSARK